MTPEWRYDEVYRGNTYIGYVMSGGRVVCMVELYGDPQTEEDVDEILGVEWE